MPNVEGGRDGATTTVHLRRAARLQRVRNATVEIEVVPVALFDAVAFMSEVVEDDQRVLEVHSPCHGRRSRRQRPRILAMSRTTLNQSLGGQRSIGADMLRSK
jgi:hypothetical protein